MVEVKEIFNSSDREISSKIRRDVFVLEQGVKEEEEFDEYDSLSRHFLGFYEKNPCGTARVRTTENGIKLERELLIVLHIDVNMDYVLEMHHLDLQLLIKNWLKIMILMR